MCLIHMNSDELKTRVSKYKYTTGYVGATGCWVYSQIDKSLVTDKDDIDFFNRNQTDVDPSGWFGGKVVWEDRWTFDGSPNILDISTPYYGYARCAIGKDKDGNLIFDNSWKEPQTPAYKMEAKKEYGVLLNNDYGKIRGVNADYIVFNEWQNPDIISTGIMFSIDSLPAPSSLEIHFSENPFPYLEMMGT